jgi:BirA family transcriptional regulator, biotin operon repressor / biotin---[acetyl-CoA-carboxylase] ligase
VVQYYLMQSNISTKAKTDFQSRLHLPQCQSTNNVLLEQLTDANPEPPEGFIVSTDHQTAGRGQQGAVWESEPGQNLLFSVYLKPTFLPVKHAFWLSAAVATAIRLALETMGVFVKVKWPNDIFLDGKKMGGILIENSASGFMLERSVVGIGLNINQLILPNGACSLAGVTGVSFNIETVLLKIRESIFLHYHILKTEGWEKIRTIYYTSLYRLATVQTYFLPDGTLFDAILKSITEDGQLVLITQKGEKRFSFKEVAFGPTKGLE